MKVIYHERYAEVYSGDPAARPGRMESIYPELCDHFEFVKPNPATEKDLRLVHTQAHINSVRRNRQLFEIASLAAGGAIESADLAMKGKPAFGLVRPPGHHASPDSCWGFCYFNNVAISIKKLMVEGEIRRPLIVDIDLHYGDGTENCFFDTPEVSYFHMPLGDNRQQLAGLSNYLVGKHECDVIALSAGFDRHLEDWGGTLTTGDYEKIGGMVKEFAERVCDGRRYAVLEGGYNHRVLGRNVKALLKGME